MFDYIGFNLFTVDMEMPELNEDLMETGEVTGEIQSDPVGEEGEEGEVSMTQTDEGKETT